MDRFEVHEGVSGRLAQEEAGVEATTGDDESWTFVFPSLLLFGVVLFLKFNSL